MNTFTEGIERGRALAEESAKETISELVRMLNRMIGEAQYEGSVSEKTLKEAAALADSFPEDVVTPKRK